MHDLFATVLHDREKRADARIWLCRDGREIAYDKLGDRHLVNILMWLRRRAQSEAEKEAESLHLKLAADGWRACMPPEWENLVEEGYSRGGMIANAMSLIDSGHALDEDLIRNAIRR